MSSNADGMIPPFNVAWDSKFRCDYCNNPKIFTISTMLTHFRECPEAIYGSGKADNMKTAKQMAKKVILSKKKDKSAYKVSDKAKQLERKNRYEVAFKNDTPFPIRGMEEISGFKFTTWVWHPFYFSPIFFHYDDVPSESYMHYRNYVESLANSGYSLLKVRDLKKYIKELQPRQLSDELKTKVTSEVLKGVSCIAQRYMKRLTSFHNCLFGKKGKKDPVDKYSKYEFTDWLNHTITMSREQLLQKIFYSGESMNLITCVVKINNS